MNDSSRMRIWGCGACPNRPSWAPGFWQCSWSSAAAVLSQSAAASHTATSASREAVTSEHGPPVAPRWAAVTRIKSPARDTSRIAWAKLWRGWAMSFHSSAELRRRHPADRVHHRAGPDPEDPHTSRRTTRATAGVARSWTAHRLGELVRPSRSRRLRASPDELPAIQCTASERRRSAAGSLAIAWPRATCPGRCLQFRGFSLVCSQLMLTNRGDHRHLLP